MVEINSNAAGLQSRLQAQLQSNSGKRATQSAADLTPRPSDLIKEKLGERTREQAEVRQQAQSRRNDRADTLSTSRELAVAEEKVNQLNANNREAPVGRLSQQSGSQRNVPLGQIVDIRV